MLWCKRGIMCRIFSINSSSLFLSHWHILSKSKCLLAFCSLVADDQGEVPADDKEKKASEADRLTASAPCESLWHSGGIFLPKGIAYIAVSLCVVLSLASSSISPFILLVPLVLWKLKPPTDNSSRKLPCSYSHN